MVVRNEVGSGAPRPIDETAAAVAVAPKSVPKPIILPKATPAAVIVTPPPTPTERSPSTKPPHAPYYVQLASRSSEAAARDYWSTQRRAQGDLLDGLSPVVTTADLGPKGIMYRLKAGPLADRAAASALCARLAKHQLDCLVVRDIAARPAP
jgi:cell division septation protein DedD